MKPEYSCAQWLCASPSWARLVRDWYTPKTPRLNMSEPGYAHHLCLIFNSFLPVIGTEYDRTILLLL
jgi:hypothetical protein